MATSAAAPGRSPRIGGRGKRWPGLDLVLVAFLVAYGALYQGWYLFRWGGAELELVIADGAFIPVGVVVVALGLLAARRARTAAGRRAWLLISFAFASFCIGDILWFWMEVVLGASPYPSIADLGYLAFYPLLLVGLLAQPRERPENLLRAALDLAIVIVGTGTVVWYLILAPVAAAASSDGLTSLLALAYPVGDLLVVFALAATLMSRLVDTSRPALTLLGLGLVLNVVADLSYARLSLEDSYVSGGWMDWCYLLAWVLMGLAAYSQARSQATSTPDTRLVPIHPVSFPPYLAVAGVYAVLLLASGSADSSQRVVVAGALLVTGLVVARQVITSRENARLLADVAATRSAARFRAIIQNANDVIAVLDRTGAISYVAPSILRLVGRPADSFRGQKFDTLVAPEDAPLALELLRSAMQHPGPGDTIGCRVQTKDDRPLYVEANVNNLLDDPLVAGLVVTMRDVTERRTFEEQLRNQAFHDPLTGLANRALLANRCEHALWRGQRRNANPSLLYLDIDDFKQINDTLGHRVGDRVLVEVAGRISGALRAEDTAARLGGDEFAILIDETHSVDEALAVADRIIASLVAPIDIDGAAVVVRASIGIVRPAARLSDPADLLRDADIAMYEAKRAARGGYRVFEPAMFAATVERVSLEADLRTALAAGQFELVYQPLFDLSALNIAGVEALLRWNHPTRGLVMPMEFIPVAERTGEIIPIGRWVIEQACATVSGLNAAEDVRPIRANVNVSASQLEPRLVDDVAGILWRTGLPADLLVLEITESVFGAARSSRLGVLTAIRSLGVRVSIDDFGTGYSSLSVLRDLPVDELKIDRSFIERLRSEGEAGLIEAIIKLGHDFNLSVVGEGIEVEEQQLALRTLGCDVGQGFLLGRPGPAAGVAALLRQEFHSSSDGRLASAGSAAQS